MTGDPDLIVRVAARGDGVTADGRHVPRAAPGDRLAEGGGLVPGPHHADPPCRHFDACGGCQLQHLDESALADFVRDRVLNALAAQDVPVGGIAPAHLSPPGARRRVALRGTRLGKRFLFGFSGEGSHRIVDLAQCPVMHPALFALVAPLRRFLAQHGGAARAVQAKLALTDQGADCLIEGAAFEGLAAQEALIAFAGENRLARLSVDEGYGGEARWEPQPVTVSPGGVAVPYPPHAFLQATADGEAALLAAVREGVGAAARVADLFAGLGTFALALAGGRRMLAAEADRAAILALKAGANAAGLPVAAEHRDLYRRPLEAPELSEFDAVILDPPRAGAQEQIDRLAASAVPVIAYVSCNPMSFARDAKRLLAGGYRLDRVTPVGQFRWSTHVELAGIFRR